MQQSPFKWLQPRVRFPNLHTAIPGPALVELFCVSKE